MLNKNIMKSGSTNKERASTVSRAHSTQVSPFQQNVLILNDRQLTNSELNAYLIKHRALDKIDLSSNKITRVPYPDLLHFSSTLTQLCLENNRIKTIAEEALRQVPGLSLLKLRGNMLMKLPDSLFSLAALKVLDVSCNKLTIFSPKVSLMRQLRLINIAENQLEGLPNSMGYLASLESITSEFFIYLPDQDSGNNQSDSNRRSMPQSKATRGDLELDWISKHHKRMTMTYSGSDARFRKLMTYMRQQDDLISTLLDLVHEFQHIEGEYRMIDVEDIIMTTEDDDSQLHLPLNPNQKMFNVNLNSLPLVHDANAQLNPESLQVYSQYLNRSLYNKLVMVYRMLNPFNVYSGGPQSNSTQTMLHFLVENGHAHLLTQFQRWINQTMEESLIQLAKTKDKVANNDNQVLISCLQTCFTNKMRQTINLEVTDRGLTALDVVVKG